MIGGRGRCRLTGLALALLAMAAAAPGQQRVGAPAAKTTRVRPNEFGVQDYTVTVIHASAFTADVPYVTDYGSLTRYFPFDSVHHHYFAGLSEIPSGVIIDYFGLECASTATGELTLTPFYVDRYSGTTSGIVALPNTPHSFDTDYNADALGWQLVQNAHNSIVLDVDQAPNSEPLFGWVEIWWHRAVSPTPAVASFDDVPMSHPFFQFIEALKASGITGGCQASPPLYCPDSPLTRGQMAVFLAKALGLHWQDHF